MFSGKYKRVCKQILKKKNFHNSKSEIKFIGGKKMNKTIETAAKVLAGVGAVNWGLSLFNFDLLSFVPAGIIKTVAVAAIGLSGATVLYLVYKKKI